VRVIGHGDDGVLPAFAAAAETGAALIVGPLTRDDVKTVLAMALTKPRVLVLNQPEDGSALPDDVYALTLSIDSDAALVARRVRDDGARAIATVASDAPLQRRFKAAFAAAWERAGGAPTHDYRFDPNPEVLRALRRELAARPTDATLLAVGSGDAALAKSFLPPGPVYASSQIADDLPGPMLRDLEGVRYVEIPWLADPSSPALARFPRADLSDPVL
jgi:outer membrane PBP1 activator LpoA protein